MASEVVGKVKALSSKAEFKWEISNFHALASCRNVGDVLGSPEFTTYSPCKIQWRLKLHPKGRKIDDGGYTSLFLRASVEIEARCTFKVLNMKGEEIVHKEFQKQVFTSKAYCGPSKFLSPDSLAQLIGNDKITIVCEIAITEDEASDRIKLIQEQEDDIQSRLEAIDKCEALFNDNKFSDVSLVSEGKTVKVHKCIIANSSTVFAAMFDTDMEERQKNTVEIEDIEYDVLVEMMRFVYAGKANNMDALAGELAIAAEKYALGSLKSRCEKTMMKNLSIDNVVHCLQLADKLRMDKLMEKAIELIIEASGNDIIDKPEFEALPSDVMCKVFRSFAKSRSK